VIIGNQLMEYDILGFMGLGSLEKYSIDIVLAIYVG
jgi:hypothetical protein